VGVKELTIGIEAASSAQLNGMGMSGLVGSSLDCCLCTNRPMCMCGGLVRLMDNVQSNPNANK
jgi:hypothetical protein